MKKRDANQEQRIQDAKDAIRETGQVGTETIDELRARIINVTPTTMPINNDDVMAGNYGVVTYMSPVKADKYYLLLDKVLRAETRGIARRNVYV